MLTQRNALLMTDALTVSNWPRASQDLAGPWEEDERVWEGFMNN